MQTHEVIKTRRSVLGMSQPELADAAGISQRQLARYEDAANPTQPPLDVADRLAAALGISLLTLAGHGVPALDLSGTWYSAWQTWMDDVERVEMERLTIRQDGEFVRIIGESDPDHADTGSYSWVGEARLIRNRSVCGWYAATDEGISSCGTIQLVFNTHGTLALGRWSGLSHDGISESGWGAMASTEALARAALAAIADTPGTLQTFPDLSSLEFGVSQGEIPQNG